MLRHQHWQSSHPHKSLLLVSNKLNQIEDYPEDAGEPTLDTAGLDDNAIAWFIVTKTKGNNENIAAYGDIVEDIIQDRIERIPGIARTTAYGDSETELRVTINPEKLAYYGLTVPKVAEILRNENSSISAGDIEEGKRKYIVRAEGEIKTIEQLNNIVVISELENNGSYGRVTISDIAEVEFTFKEPRSIADKKSVKIIKNYLKISCSIDNAPSTLNKFFKKNKLNLFISDDYFPVVKTINRKIKINFSSNINRSLEYYSGMVFNITVNKKGKKFSLISGGRYDGLLKNLGSKKNTTAVGAAIDMSLL